VNKSKVKKYEADPNSKDEDEEQDVHGDAHI